MRSCGQVGSEREDWEAVPWPSEQAGQTGGAGRGGRRDAGEALVVRAEDIGAGAGEADDRREPRLGECAVPLAAEEPDDGQAPVRELGAVAPPGPDCGDRPWSAAGARRTARAKAVWRTGSARGIDQISAEAGVAKSNLARALASTEAWIGALREQPDRKLRASMGATVEAAEKLPTKRLLAVFDWLEGWFGSADFNGCVFIRALSEYPEARHAIHRTAWNHKGAVKAMLAQLCEAAEAQDPGGLAETRSLLIAGAIVAAQGTRETGSARAARATAAVVLKLAAA